MKSKKRITLLAVLVCVFALVLSLGIFSACGNDGENGGTATAGGSYLYGTTAPDEGLGKAGDYYLDTETLSAYVKTADGEWVQTALYSGTGAPDANEGKQGDLYLDTTGGVLYQKGESLWSIVLKVKGRDGVVWFSGSKEPTDPENETLLQGAMKGDFYLQTTDFTVWQLGADGKWQKLGSIKGDKGDDSVHVFYGTGVPEGNSAVEGAVDGDLYFGTFDGFEVDDKGAGTVLYRYNDDGTWEELMSDRKEGQINIRTAEQLKKFAESVTAENSYKDREVHLKADIDLSKELETVSAAEKIAGIWTPIGTSDAPFKGTFDGEGHTISNLTAAAAGTENAGLFGTIENATILNLGIAAAHVSSEGGKAGIVAAEVKGESTIKDVTVTGSTISGETAAGGLFGEAVEGANLKVQGSSSELLTESGDKLETTWAENSQGTEPDSSLFEIPSPEGLREFANLVNGGETGEGKTFEGITVVLTADVDLAGALWTPVGSETVPFMGTFEGGSVQGGKVTPETRTISNMKIALEENENKFAAFFGYTKNATICNLRFINADVTNRYKEGGGIDGYAAVLVGLAAQKIEIRDVTIGSPDELKNEERRPYVVMGKAGSAFISKTLNEQDKLTIVVIDKCMNYADICAPKATGFVAQYEGWSGSSLTITNSDNYGRLIVPTKGQGLEDFQAVTSHRDVVMGAFVGYNQNNNTIKLIKCNNFGNIEATIVDNQEGGTEVGKINIGGFISSARSTTDSVIVDCIQKGNITIDVRDEGTAYGGEIGGIVGSGGTSMYHVEQYGDISITSAATFPNAEDDTIIRVGGVCGEGKNNFHLKSRNEYTEIPAGPEAQTRNTVDCSIIVKYTGEKITHSVGAATGTGSAPGTIEATDLKLFIQINPTNEYGLLEGFGHLGGMTGSEAEYSIKDTVLRLKTFDTEDGDFTKVIKWGPEGEKTES